MRFYKKYLEKRMILKRMKTYGFPNAKFVELLVYDFEMYRQLLEISDEFVLKGGACTQLYLPIEKQRTSIDIDILTSLNKEDVEDIFFKNINTLDFVDVKTFIPKEKNESLPLHTYLVDLPSIVGDDETTQLKIDILFENIENYRICSVKNKELFALNLADPIPCIKLGCLISDKLLTLACKSVGVTQNKIDHLPKHLYDLTRLIDLFSETDYKDLLFSFRKVAYSELEYRNLKYSLSDVIDHIDEVLLSFINIDRVEFKNDLYKKLINDFQSTYVNKESRDTLQNWIVSCLKLKRLLSSIRCDLEKEDMKGYFNYKKVIDRFEKIKNLSIQDKKILRDELLKKAKNNIDDWKYLKGKSEERIFLVLNNED